MTRTTASLLLASLPLLGGCCSLQPSVPSEWKNLRGLCREVLAGYATPFTHEFDAYDPAPFGFESRDLARSLLRARLSDQQSPEAVLVVGPFGPLFAFDVYAFFREGQQIRAHMVRIAHSRIRDKLILVSEASRLRSLVGAIEGSNCPRAIGRDSWLVFTAAQDGNAGEPTEVACGYDEGIERLIDEFQIEATVTYRNPPDDIAER